VPPFIIPLISPILDKVLSYLPDPAARAKAALEAQQALQEAQEKAMALIASQNQQQASIDATEAASTNWFVAAWRPAIGWVCASAFAWVYVLQPVLVFGFNAVHHPVTLPTIDFSQMSTVLMGMLGLAGLRTYEKSTDTEGNR
jgi:hypothetical protein